MPQIRVNDINIYYEIHGEGFPFLLIRGFTSDIYRWPSNFIKELSYNFKIILFDNRGAGRTDKPDIEYTIKMMADDTVGLMNNLNIGKANILGYSMGGSIAQEITLSYPERVNKLILCGAGPGRPIDRPVAEVVEESQYLSSEVTAPEEDLRKILPTLFPKSFIKSHPKEIEEYVRRSILAPIPAHSKRRQAGAIVKFESLSRLKNIKNPTLIITGKKDVLVNPQGSKILAENIQGAKLIQLDEVGHAMFTQEPLLLARTINDFLK
ncbi:MAG: alpha/beta fold hydrolase [Promethearchaeota archaeon]|jgi:pimeloyl-ACP methyl ester carboxylesterase